MVEISRSKNVDIVAFHLKNLYCGGFLETWAHPPLLGIISEPSFFSELIYIVQLTQRIAREQHSLNGPIA
jgi:hypothetical protein